MFEEWNVLVKKLLLKVFGAGGDDDPLAGANGGNEIGEGFPGAGTGFDDEMALFCQSLFDCLSHLQLATAKLVSGVGASEDTSGSEELIEGTLFIGGSRCGWG